MAPNTTWGADAVQQSCVSAHNPEEKSGDLDMAQACNLALEEAGGSKAAFATESVGSPHLKNQSKTRRAEVESEHTRAGFSRHPQRRGKETGTCHILDEPADTATPRTPGTKGQMPCHCTQSGALGAEELLLTGHQVQLGKTEKLSFRWVW